MYINAILNGELGSPQSPSREWNSGVIMFLRYMDPYLTNHVLFFWWLGGKIPMGIKCLNSFASFACEDLNLTHMS